MKRIICILFMIFALTTVAYAAPFSIDMTNDNYSTTDNGIPTPRNGGFPAVHDAVNKLLGTTYTLNEEIDYLFVSNDSLWTSSEDKLKIIGYSAGYSNLVGLYSTSDTHDITIAYSGFGFDDVGDGVFDLYDINSNGNTFGWYLDSNYETFYSESHLNSDGMDHMITYRLPGPLYVNEVLFENPHLIAWEDLSLRNGRLGDEDYNDLIYLVDAAPVPEPSTIMLVSLGIMGLVGMRKRNGKHD
jgi:hypothetical protein